VYLWTGKNAGLLPRDNYLEGSQILKKVKQYHTIKYHNFNKGSSQEMSGQQDLSEWKCSSSSSLPVKITVTEPLPPQEFLGRVQDQPQDRPPVTTSDRGTVQVYT
jgi:hypothetical protein